MSILIIILIAAVIFCIIKFSAGSKRRSYISSYRAGRILGGYVVILLICTLVVSIFTPSDGAEMKTVHIKDVEKQSEELQEAIAEGKLNQLNPRFIGKKWSFHYTEQKLLVETENTLDTQIIVERKDSNEDNIDVVYYRSKSTMNNTDITSLKNMPRMILEGNTLTIKKPKKFKMDFYQFQNPFPVAQFNNEHLFSHNTSFYGGSTVLYLHIPKDLEIIDKTNRSMEFVK